MELKIGNKYVFTNSKDSWCDSARGEIVRLISYDLGGNCQVQFSDSIKEPTGWFKPYYIINCYVDELKPIK